MSAFSLWMPTHAPLVRAPALRLRFPEVPVHLLRRGFCALLVAAGIALTAGCDRATPTLARIDARNFGVFYAWRATVSSQFSPAEWRDFNAAVQELRLRAMASGVSGTAAIDVALCRAIDGRSVKEVLVMADEAKLDRLRATHARLKEMLDANALLAARPGDVELDAALRRRRIDQEDRLLAVVAEIKATTLQLVAHGGKAPPPLPDNPNPAVLSRDEALSEFTRLIETRRRIAADYYGDWPARVDRTGADLAGLDKEEFAKKKAAADYNGHVVIPVHIRANWRIFDAVVQYPEFTSAVTKHLTPDDLRLMNEDWAESEAEIWARKQASLDTSENTVARIKRELEGVMR